MLAQVKKNIEGAEKILDEVESELERISSDILSDNLTQKQASEVILIMSERVAAACDELRELLGKKRIQTEKV